MPGGSATAPQGPRKLLIITNDTIGERMAGPGIRTWELARVLSHHVQVDLAVPPFVDFDPRARPDFPAQIHGCRRMDELQRLTASADMVMTLGAVPLACPFLARLQKPLILDAYDPFLLAGLEVHRGDPGRRQSIHEEYRRALLVGLGAADLVLCASERQRDFWVGMLSALGRVNPRTVDGDPTLSRLLRVVPFGVPETPPRQVRPALKGVYPGIDPTDRVVLWGGGLWDWLDAGTAIRAMALVAETRRDVKLFFMGTRRPNKGIAGTAALDEAVALGRELGLLDRSVIFNSDWVPYADRQNVLLEADLGICLHRDTLETRFAARTRLLDYMWAGLPAITTSGDTVGEEMQGEGLAKAVPPGAERAVAGAILDLLESPGLKVQTRPRFEAMAARYRWEVAAAPLVDFCLSPRLAPDRPHRSSRARLVTPRSWRHVALKVKRAVRRGWRHGS